MGFEPHYLPLHAGAYTNYASKGIGIMRSGKNFDTNEPQSYYTSLAGPYSTLLVVVLGTGFEPVFHP